MSRNLTDISGVGVQTAKELSDGGFKTVKSIARASTNELGKVQGFGLIRAEKTIHAANALLKAAKSSPLARTTDSKKAKINTQPDKEKKDMASKRKKKIKKLKKELGKKKLKKKVKKKLKKKLKKLKKK